MQSKDQISQKTGTAEPVTDPERILRCSQNSRCNRTVTEEAVGSDGHAQWATANEYWCRGFRIVHDCSHKYSNPVFYRCDAALLFFLFYSIGIRRKEHQSRIDFFNEEKHAFSVLLSLLTISSFPLLSLPSNWPPPENSPENVISSLTSGFALLSSYCGRKRLMVSPASVSDRREMCALASASATNLNR